MPAVIRGHQLRELKLSQTSEEPFRALVVLSRRGPPWAEEGKGKLRAAKFAACAPRRCSHRGGAEAR